MTQKNDTPVLVVSFLLTAALLGGGGWWLMKQFGNSTPLPGASNASTGSSTSSSSPNSTSPGLSSSNPISSGSTPSGSTDSSSSTFATVSNVPTGLFNYGGSTSWAPIRRDLDALISQTHPGFQLRYTNPATGTPGSGTGIQMLLNNQLSFAQSSRSLKSEEIQAAQQQGFSLKEIPVALEGIAIAVHPDLDVFGITIDQLRGIYTGQITNWNQVGGPNLAITPYTRSLEAGGTVEFFVDTILEGQDFGFTTQLVGTTTEALRKVSTDIGGLYYASAPEVVGQCTTKPLAIGKNANQLTPIHQPPLIPPTQCPNQRNKINTSALLDGSYPITRRLLVIVKENGQAEQQAGEAYADLILSGEGQALLEKSGFVRIR